MISNKSQENQRKTNFTVQREPSNLLTQNSNVQEKEDFTESWQNDKLNEVTFTLIETALNEIKEFISIMFKVCIGFYETQILINEIQEMREDLIERITTMIFHVDQGELTELVLYLCKIDFNYYDYYV